MTTALRKLVLDPTNYVHSHRSHGLRLAEDCAACAACAAFASMIHWVAPPQCAAMHGLSGLVAGRYGPMHEGEIEPHGTMRLACALVIELHEGASAHEIESYSLGACRASRTGNGVRLLFLTTLLFLGVSHLWDTRVCRHRVFVELLCNERRP